MCLAVGEAAAHGRADAGSEHRIDRVEVEADVQERQVGQELERLAEMTTWRPRLSISLIV